MLTGLVDSRVVTELQHIEVSPLHAAPDAVDTCDVRTLVVHFVQGPHQVTVAVVLEGHRSHQLAEQEEVEEE